MKKFSPVRRQRGVALLEAMIAVVILGIGLIGTVGLQARAYSALNDAGLRAEATMAADTLIGTMSADSANISNYALADGATPNATLKPWVSETQAHIPNAKITVVVTPAPALRRTLVSIAIRWTHRGGGPENRHLITAYIES
ncbi:MAG: prepilin-type N-terminal cleavage/methylation domain-containing protein [Sphingomonadaceae bacterium]